MKKNHLWKTHKPVKFTYGFRFPDGTVFTTTELMQMPPEQACNIKIAYDKAWKTHRHNEHCKEIIATRRRERRRLKRQAKKLANI